MPESLRIQSARLLAGQFPDAPALTLARRLIREYPELFDNVEQARGAVRTVFGARGHRSRRDYANHTLYRDARKAGQIVIPAAFKTYEQEWGNHAIPTPGRWGVVADIHAPYHDSEAVSSAVAYLKRIDPVGLVILGDLVDHYQISIYQPDPRQRRLADEVRTTREFLRYLRAQFPKARLVWKEGNHEERLENYLRLRAPELLGLDVIDLPQLYECDKLGCETVRDKRPLALGSLILLHGHEYKFAISNPVNPARGLFLRSKANALCGHFHQRSQHSERNLAGKVISCWSVGCLCELHPRFLPLNNWCHGLALVEIDRTGAFQVENKIIINGTVY